jgi:hypothetical protein
VAIAAEKSYKHALFNRMGVKYCGTVGINNTYQSSIISKECASFHSVLWKFSSIFLNLYSFCKKQNKLFFKLLWYFKDNFYINQFYLLSPQAIDLLITDRTLPFLCGSTYCLFLCRSIYCLFCVVLCIVCV